MKTLELKEAIKNVLGGELLEATHEFTAAEKQVIKQVDKELDRSVPKLNDAISDLSAALISIQSSIKKLPNIPAKKALEKVLKGMDGQLDKIDETRLGISRFMSYFTGD